MMEMIEVSGKTLDDAILEAAIQLGTTRDKVAYEVICQGSTGFFGIGGKKAVIKAHVKSEEEIQASLKAEKEVEKILEKVNEKESKKEIKKETKAVEPKPVVKEKPVKEEKVVAAKPEKTEKPKKIVTAANTEDVKEFLTSL